MRNSVACIALSMFWSQSEHNYIHPLVNQCLWPNEKWPCKWAFHFVKCTCVGNCDSYNFLPYQWDSLPYSPTSIIMPSNATLPGHYPTLTIVVLKGLRKCNIFPLRSAYLQWQEHHPFSHQPFWTWKTPWGK